MKRLLLSFALLALLPPFALFAQEAKPAVPVRKITPGKVIVPTERMRRIWGELVSLDLATRTGKFRNESNDEVMSFTVMPYAELLHHATSGDLQDFRVGERAIFRLHENEQGDWEVFLDEASLLKFQAEQKAVHAKRMATEGLPGYVDAIADGTVQITLFREAADARKSLKAGATVRVSPAGVDRKPVSVPESATVARVEGDKITLTISSTSKASFQPTGLARIWTPQE